MRTCYMVKGNTISLVEHLNKEQVSNVVIKNAGSRVKAFEIANQLNMAILLGMQLALGDSNIKNVIKKEVNAAIKAKEKKEEKDGNNSD